MSALRQRRKARAPRQSEEAGRGAGAGAVAAEAYVRRMEALGRLMGGVAHDFNNLLTILRGYTELLAMELEGNEEGQAYLEEMMAAADRAVELTKQLSAFSRRAGGEGAVAMPLPLGEILMGSIRMLRRFVGEGVELVVELEEEIEEEIEEEMEKQEKQADQADQEENRTGRVALDREVIEALCIRLAADAVMLLPGGGRLGFKVMAAPGRRAEGWIALEVTVKGAEGELPWEPVEVYREWLEPAGAVVELKKGGNLRVLLPRAPAPASTVVPTVVSVPGKGNGACRVSGGSTESRKLPEALPRGAGETVLLVEDDGVVRKMMGRQLEALGYRVLLAAHGEEALRVVKQYPKIDLVLTDLVMPLMGGAELAERLETALPFAKVALMSGYPIAGGEGALKMGNCFFLAKPLSRRQLACKLREFLENK